MRIVIHFKDDTRQAYDTSFLVYGDDHFEFDSQGICYSIFRKDIVTLHVSEAFDV